MNTDKNPQPDEQPNKVFCCPECGSDEITVVRTEVHEYSAYPETSWNPTRGEWETHIQLDDCWMLDTLEEVYRCTTKPCTYETMDPDEVIA